MVSLVDLVVQLSSCLHCLSLRVVVLPQFYHWDSKNSSISCKGEEQKKVEHQ